MQNNTGLFVPNTFIWELDLLNSTDINTPAFKEMLVRLYQNLNSVTLALNLKDSAYYVQNEFLNGQVFFPNPNISSTPDNVRQAFRKVVNFGALPNSTTKSVAHGINIMNSFCFTRIYGTASDPISLAYKPIPYASTVLANNIQIDVDRTNVTITTGAAYSSYSTCYIILEYVKE